MSDGPKRTESDRALKLEQRIREIQSSTTKIAEERQKEIDDALKRYLSEVAGEVEEDTKVRNLKDIARNAGIDVDAILNRSTPTPKIPRPANPPAVITRPPITRPGKEVLKDTRREPTPVPPSRESSVSEPSIRPITPRWFPAKPDPSVPSGDKLLVVDDDPAVVRQLSSILREEGFAVVYAHDGWDAAMRLAEMPRVDLILLDWLMPRVNGAEFMSWLNKPNNPWSHVPVVIISASKPTLEDDDRFVFLGKPIDVEVLLRTIRGRIKQHRMGQ